MVFIKKGSSSIKQLAYAKRLLGGQGTTKKEIALNSGYSSAVSRSVKSHIEDTDGFNNAMAVLAVDSNNLALAVMHQFKARGFDNFSNKELVGALNAIGSAWSKFNQIQKEKAPSDNANKLRTVILQRVENQTIAPGADTSKPLGEEGNPTSPSGHGAIDVEDVEDPMDF